MQELASPVKNDDSRATLSRENLLEASELLLDNLGSPSLTSRSIQWDNFPALMKLWEVLWQAQASLVQEAERLSLAMSDLQGQHERLQEIQVDLHEITSRQHDERDRHFGLALCWRRHAVWRYFRTHLQHPEQARDLLHLYLVKPVGGGQMTGEACRPKCRDKAEQSLLLQIASTQRNRIRQHAQWLADHPEAAALLRDTKNKGKGKERESNQDDIVYKEKAHFERCLEEVEPRQRLKELIASTRDWIECFKERLEAVQEAQHILESVRVIRESLLKEEETTKNPKRILENGTYDRPEERPKRRKTIDRGTSPIQEVVEKSLYLDYSHDYSEKVPDQAREPAQNAMQTGQALSTENPSQEDDSPPSPQSLPSPPPNAQIRPKQSAQATTEGSQQSTADSSAKPASIPSVPSLPPIRSSSPVGGEDSFKITIRQTNVASDLLDLGAATSIATSKVEVVRKPKKRASKLPPITPEIHNLLEEASREAARRRKEEKQRLGEFDYDPWSELVGWVPPESSSARAEEQSSRKPSPAIVTETTPIDTSVEEFTTARTHIVKTFDALDADSSENASQGRREREENEAMIAAFLREEEL